MERGRSEGQTFQPLKKVHRLEEEENIIQKRSPKCCLFENELKLKKYKND